MLNLHVDFTPIDCASQAIMEIVHNANSEKTIFHIENPNLLRFDNALQILSSLGIDIATKDDASFSQFLRETKYERTTEQFFEAFLGNIDDNNNLRLESGIRIGIDFTVEYLEKLGYVWPNISEDYMKMYIDYFRRIGYWMV